MRFQSCKLSGRTKSASATAVTDNISPANATQLWCLAHRNRAAAGASCGGKYQYCNCKSEYKYTSANCPSPQILSGKVCGGQYTGCSCPSGVSENDFGCAEYYPSPCSSVCKTPKSDNCDNRTEVSTPYGCAEYWEDCSSKCKTAYNDNCRNRTEVSCEYSCASYFADCQSKCQACGSNPDCSVTGKTCENGCKTTNSCGICTECRADTKKLCNADGYTETSCPNLYEISNCPYDDSYKKCTKTCAAVLAGAKTVSTAAELKSADAYDATIMMLNDITVSGTMMFRSKDIIWPSDEVCASQYPTRPTLTIGTFTMSDESTRHLIDVNINAQTIDIPVSGRHRSPRKSNRRSLHRQQRMAEFARRFGNRNLVPERRRLRHKHRRQRFQRKPPVAGSGRL